MEHQNRISRRQFVKRAAAIGAGAAALGTGSVVAAESTRRGKRLPAKWDREVDVVVAGSGCGLLAAAMAADAGASTLVLEKRDEIGGSAAASGGVIYAAGTSVQKAAGVEDSKDAMYEDWMRSTSYDADPELVRVIADRATDVVEWFLAHGVEIPTDPTFLYQSGEDKIRRGHTVKERIGAGYTRALEKYLQEKDVPILLDHRAQHLYTDEDGRVIGVRALTAGGTEVNIAARQAVILATGGFAEDKDLIRQYLPLSANDIFFGPPGSSVGDGLRMAQAVGADTATTHYHNVPFGNVFVVSAAQKAGWSGLRLLNSIVGGFPPTFKSEPGSFILVNKLGKRFVSDVDFYKVIVGATYQQPDVTGYMIFDESLRADERFTLGMEWTRDELTAAIEQGWVQKGETLEELAEKLGIDAAGLKETVAKYNEDANAGKDSEFDRTGATLKTIETPPFYGVDHKPGFQPIGGIRINTKAQVLTRDRSVIPGLYACGGQEIGGVLSTGYPGSGSYLASGFTFAMIAGQMAAAEEV